MSCTVASFMEHLRASELFSTERIDAHWEASRAFLSTESLKPQADARPLADWFIRSAILTSWQAKQLLSGCSRGFFLGRYRLLKLLGHGGMSVVYLAFDPIRNSGVALKVLTPRRVRKSSVYDRFRLEAEALCRVRHPNVIRAYALEYGEQSGRGERSITGSYEMRPHSKRSGTELTEQTEATLLAEIERQTDQWVRKTSDSCPSFTLSEEFSLGKKSPRTDLSLHALDQTQIATNAKCPKRTAQSGGDGNDDNDDGNHVGNAGSSGNAGSASSSKLEPQDDAAGYWFLVMEYIEGRNLGALIQDYGPLSVEVATEYLRQAAEGVAAVHAAGFVHRDIKPSNFIVEWTGQVRLLDMGLARFGEETPDGLTPLHADRVFGTADYLAPEQIRNSHIVDGRADLYGLGGTFYAMLTGEPPFPADTVGEKLDQQLYTTAPDLRLLRADVPKPLARLGRKLLAKKPYQRPQSAREVADALQNYLDQRRQTLTPNVVATSSKTVADNVAAADDVAIIADVVVGKIADTVAADDNVAVAATETTDVERVQELALPLDLSLPDDSPRLLSERVKTIVRVLPRAESIPIALTIPQATVWKDVAVSKESVALDASVKTLSEDQVIHFLLGDESPLDVNVSEDSEDDDVFDPSLFDEAEDDG